MSKTQIAFISYSHKDIALRDELLTHIALLKREGVLAEWHDGHVQEGSEWDKEIRAKLETCSIVILLVSADFLASQYIWEVEVAKAMERHDAGTARVIPVIVRPCDWHSAPFGRLKALPLDGKAVVAWLTRDEAWASVARAVRGICR